MNIDQIRDALPDYARDLKLNLGSVLTTTGAPGLNEKQVWSIALASAIAARNTQFARHIEAVAKQKLADVGVAGGTAAAAIMALTKLDFELISLAVSAVNGCGLCVTSHEKKLRSHDVSRESIQSAVRIAATIHAVAVTAEFEQSPAVAAGAAEMAA